MILPPNVKKAVSFLLRIAFAALLLYFVVRGGKITWSDLLRCNPWCLAAAFACIAGQSFLTCCRWFLLLHCSGAKISFLECVSLSMQGVAFSLFIPAGSVGGDLIKAGILAKRAIPGEKFRSVFSILTDRLCGLIALFGSALLSCLFFWKEIESFPPALRTGIYAVMLGTAIVLSGAIAVFFHDFLYRIPFCRTCMAFADRYSKGAFTNAAESIAAYRRHWKLVIFCIAYSLFAAFPLLAGGIWFIAKGLGAAADYPISWFASNVSQSIAAIPSTPGGIGTRDAVCKFLLRALGYSEEAATLTPLLFTVLLLIFSALGLLFFIFDRGRRTGK